MNDIAGMIVVAVVNSLWLAFALTLAVWLWLKFQPQVNAATRYAVWWCVLVVVAAAPLAPQTKIRGTSVPVETSPQAEPDAAAPPAPSSPLDLPAPPAVRTGVARLPVEAPGGVWFTAVFAAWAAMLLFRLTEIARSYRYLSGVQRRARPATIEERYDFDCWVLSCRVGRPVRLLISREIAAPMAVGFLRPAVIVPESLMKEFQTPELDHVALHELAHIARRDDWTNLAAKAAGAFLALHPVAAWILKRMEREREMACDDWVVSMTCDARGYASSLTRLFEMCSTARRQLLAAGMADHASRLGERIEMLLRGGRDFIPSVSLGRVGVGAVILLGLLAAGGQTPPWIAFAAVSAHVQEEPFPPTPPPAPSEAPAAPPVPITPAAREPAPPSVAPIPLAAPAAPAIPPVPPIPAPLLTEPVAPPVPPLPPLSMTPLPPIPPPAPLQQERQEQIANGTAPASAKTSFLAALVAAGYGNLSVDEIIDLKNHGVSGEFLNAMNQAGWGKLTPRQLIELRNHGVSASYLQQMRQAGLKDLSLEQVIQLRNHGVQPQFFIDVHALGFGPYTAREAIEFSKVGARADFFRALREAGFTAADPREIIEAAANGVRASDLREAREYGPNLTLRQIIRLKQAGVI